ncbi:transposase, partial [Xanthomonas vasicola pv. vasculorum NCPPB 895]
MQLQHQRIFELCGQLKLEAVAAHYPELASKAVTNQLSFADFLEGLLKNEV